MWIAEPLIVWSQARALSFVHWVVGSNLGWVWMFVLPFPNEFRKPVIDKKNLVNPGVPSRDMT